jgi:pSer/pThr/pTyr-binding forkhead associated (FHA) protein
LFDSGAFADLVPPKSSKPAAGKTGGRLVCLTDGREYQVGSGALTLGRDAGSNVVVSGGEVSRQHAEIRSDAEGYLLVDLSVNGTYVNGERMGKTHRLARADIIRIGNDEFRFYADASSAAPASPAAEPAQPAPPPPPAATHRLSDTMFDLRVGAAAQPAAESKHDTPPAPVAAPLASLLLRSGELKGQRLPIKVPVANIGRGDYNDVILADPSVSTMHAKLQRRDAIWILTDLGSTNGTFVEGERLTGEMPLSPGTTIKFGDVAALFEPLDESVRPERKDRTRMIKGVVVPDPPQPPPSAQPAAAAEPPAEAPRARPRPRRPIHVSPPRPKSPSTITVLGLIILVAILAYLLASY